MSHMDTGRNAAGQFHPRMTYRMRPRLLRSLILMASLTALVGRLSAQAPSPVPTFEVASMKPSARQTGPGVNVEWKITPGRVHYVNTLIREIMLRAYGIKGYQLVAPAWFDSDAWDIEATMPVDTTMQQVSLMFQQLLTERFQMVMHREQRDLPVYALTVASGGIKMVEVPPTKTTGLNNTLLPAGGMRVNGNVSMPVLIHFLQLQLRRPVVDMTGLTGVFAIQLDWTPGEMERSGAPSETGLDEVSAGPSLFTSVSETLGLKIDVRKTPVEVLVVDRAQRVPVGN